MPSWRPQSLQIVWFIAGQPSASVTDIYEALVGIKPSASQMTALPPPNIGSLSSASGTHNQVEYQVQAQPGRIDFFLRAPAGNTIPGQQPNFPLLQDADKSIDNIISMASNGPAVIGDAIRLAVVGAFIQPANNIDEANNIVSSCLGFKINMPDVLDLGFNINRRKKLQSGIEINRLMNWAVPVLQQVTFPMGGPTPMTIGVTASIHEVVAASLTVDVNTLAIPQVFTPQQQAPILQEIGNELRRLANANSPLALQ